MFSTKDLALQTASHLERHPRCYRYTLNRIPRFDHDVGCVLGWMVYFSGEAECQALTPQVIAAVTCDPVCDCDVGYSAFFRRLDECYPLYRGHWRSHAMHAVAALRAYAAEYPEAPGLPVWARMRDREAVAARDAYRSEQRPLMFGFWIGGVRDSSPVITELDITRPYLEQSRSRSGAKELPQKRSAKIIL
jgi:hypothetical protein